MAPILPQSARFLILSICLLSSCAGGGGGSGGSSSSGNPAAGYSIIQGNQVAVVETELSGNASFPLHATIPLPAKKYPSASNKLSFGYLEHDGTLIPAQVEIVSRYPNSADGADVVQLWARVRKPPTLSAGNRTSYPVVEISYQPAIPDTPSVDELVNSELELSAAMKDLVQTPGRATLRSKDVFGNVYDLDLLHGSGSSETVQIGRTTVQWRHYSELTPKPAVGGSSGTLPRLMGAHSYPRVGLQDDVMVLDLRVHNGCLGADPKNPDSLSKAYFRELEIVLPSDWVLVPDYADPFYGTPYNAGSSKTAYPIVEPNSNGSMHVMPVMSQFQRRLAITTAGNEAKAQARLLLEGLGFCKKGNDLGTGSEFFSWFNEQTGRYFPQKFALPHYNHIGATSIQNSDQNNLNSLASILLSGGVSPSNYPVSYPVLGWAHPYYGQYGGMTGGEGITTSFGARTAYACSNKGVLYQMLINRMTLERMQNGLYRQDGRAASVFDFLFQGSGFQYTTFEYFNGPVGSAANSFFGLNDPPNFHVNAVVAQGKVPPYESDLDGFQSHDYQHYSRATRIPKMLAYLVNDALSKEDLLLYAEQFRLGFHQFYNNAWQGVQGTGLLSLVNFANVYPAKGCHFGRGESWGIDVMNVAYALSDDAWRSQAKPWFDKITDLIATTQACNGYIQAFAYIKLLGGLWRARQAFEEAIIQNALRGMRYSVYEGSSDAARATTLKNAMVESVRSLIQPLSWLLTQHAPASQVAVGPLDLSLPIYCFSLPAGGITTNADTYQNWSSYAYAYVESGEQIFLDKAIEQGGGSVNALKAELWDNSYGANPDNQTSLLRLCQKLGLF